MSELCCNIVVIEDEQHIRHFVSAALEAEHFRVFEAETGKQGLVEVATRKPDLVIVDLGLPDMDGCSVIRQLRTWSSVPVLILSARSQEKEKVQGLDAGADDYLTKPFSTAELLARIRAHLRRRAVVGESPGSALFRVGHIEIDLLNRQVFREGVVVKLTPIEFRLLAMLVRNPGRVVTQRQLLAEVWGPAYLESGHYLRIYMGHLRQKLEVDPARPQHIVTETGIGYRLVVE